MTDKFIKPFLNETNITNQSKLILKSVGMGILKPKFFKVNTNEIEKEQFYTDAVYSTKFGLPTFDAFSFNANGVNKIVYEASKDFGGGEVIISDPFHFDTALIEINQTKNIVKTAIAGSDGTVKEFMSEGDYFINLRGVIVGDVANQRPDTLTLNKLIAYLKAPMSIPITCAFLDELMISSVVVESYKLSQRDGTRNVIDVEINMMSDSPIELSKAI